MENFYFNIVLNLFDLFYPNVFINSAFISSLYMIYIKNKKQFHYNIKIKIIENYH